MTDGNPICKQSCCLTVLWLKLVQSHALLQELLLTVLREWTQAYGALLLLLDDFDRADALSWLLLAQVAEQPKLAVLVVAALRPNDGIFATPTPGIGQVCFRHHEGLMQCL